jgi:hypothetical protein
MSVIAGCSLLDGVILGADCRVTYSDGRGGTTHRDTIQKLIAITPHSAIGFAGDVATASDLVLSMLQTCHRLRRYNAVSLANWIPRFFRQRYVRFKDARDVIFIVGSVVPGRPNVVERAAAARLIDHAFRSRSAVGINGLSSQLAAILSFLTPSVILPNEPMGLLYVMCSPYFKPRYFRPFDYVAIGSGKGIEEQIGQVSARIFAGLDGEHNDAMWLGMAMDRFLRVKNIQSVGGMFPMIKLRASGGIHLTQQTERTPNGPVLELAFEDDRWIQRNCTTGKEIRLMLPWELGQTQRSDHKFDDLRPRL